MLIVISPLNPDPLYKQITDQIKDAIAKGTMKPGTKIPSIRGMAEELNISAITIKRAYADLESEGFIITRSGLGSFVADINIDKLKNEKLLEIKKELTRLTISAEKFGISRDEIADLLNNITEEES